MTCKKMMRFKRRTLHRPYAHFYRDLSVDFDSEIEALDL
jgi:hypothetical protein